MNRSIQSNFNKVHSVHFIPGASLTEPSDKADMNTALYAFCTGFPTVHISQSTYLVIWKSFKIVIPRGWNNMVNSNGRMEGSSI